MKKIQLLDCTLREAPVENFLIGKNFMEEFIRRCGKVGLDVIECGFLKDTDCGDGSSCFNSAEQIRKIIPDKKKGITYVALMDCGRYSVENLEPYDGTSIDGVRICFKRGQQKDAIKAAGIVKQKGYKAYIQHVDTLDYTDVEIIEFIEMVNEVKPYAYAVVDTFGAMYEEELCRIAMLVNHHLDPDIVLGFHAHNNLMLANANAQAFISLFAYKRSIIADASVLGCGRGAGNANTELLLEYLVKKYNAQYDLDAMLDLIDNLMPRLKNKCSWGYNIPFFLSGIHSAHVYNASYLLRKHKMASKDLRAIIEKLDKTQKKNYNYEILEKIYVDYFNRDVNDLDVKKRLKEELSGKKVLILAPGKTLETEREKVQAYVDHDHPIIIGINCEMEGYHADYIFFSSITRYNTYQSGLHEERPKIIVTSNILGDNVHEGEMVVNYGALVKYGWTNLDSSIMLLLRLLALINVTQIHIAGFDGFSENVEENYYSIDLDMGVEKEDCILLTRDNEEMLVDFLKSNPKVQLEFITTSHYIKAVRKCRHYKAILFDLDGTLLDTTEGVVDAVVRTIQDRKFQMPSPKRLKEFVGPPMQQSMADQYGLDENEALKMANEFRANYRKYSLFKANLYEGVYELMEGLKEKGYLLAVATNKSHDNAISILEKFSILNLCDYALGTDLEGKLSKKDIIDQCIEKLKVEKTETVLIGDSKFDLQGAEEAGIDFIAVKYGFGYKKEETIRSRNCIASADTVDELRMLLL